MDGWIDWLAGGLKVVWINVWMKEHTKLTNGWIDEKWYDGTLYG